MKPLRLNPTFGLRVLTNVVFDCQNDKVMHSCTWATSGKTTSKQSAFSCSVRMNYLSRINALFIVTYRAFWLSFDQQFSIYSQAQKGQFAGLILINKKDLAKVLLMLLLVNDQRTQWLSANTIAFFLLANAFFASPNCKSTKKDMKRRVK